MRRAAKRLLDIIGAVIGLVFLSPVFVVIASAVAVDSPGGALFRQQRVGRGGRLFKVYKFRTMVSDASLRGHVITSADDPRITRVGAFLRDWKLDELPNLINVLRGEMSLVGPRPEVPEYVAMMRPEERRLLELKPGITGFAQLRYINEAKTLTREQALNDYEAIFHTKVAIDLEYLERLSFWFDLKIILYTLWMILRGESASDIPGHFIAPLD